MFIGPVQCQFVSFHGDVLQGEPYSPPGGRYWNGFDQLGLLGRLKGFKFFGILSEVLLDFTGARYRS
jgi:hypothetical protein